MCENCEDISSTLTSLLIEAHDMANVTVIDSEGDIILVCGKTELQVSSKVLRLASPVFTALFGPGFAEGQAVSSKASRIRLLDDDAESMHFLCSVLHHKCTSANSISLEKLEKVAVVTDKDDVRLPPRSLDSDESIILVARLCEIVEFNSMSLLCHGAVNAETKHLLTACSVYAPCTTGPGVRLTTHNTPRNPAVYSGPLTHSVMLSSLRASPNSWF